MGDTRIDVFVGGLPPSIGQDAVENALTSLGIAPLKVAWQQDSGCGVVQVDSERTAVSACLLLRQVTRCTRYDESFCFEYHVPDQRSSSRCKAAQWACMCCSAHQMTHPAAHGLPHSCMKQNSLMLPSTPYCATCAKPGEPAACSMQ